MALASLLALPAALVMVALFTAAGEPYRTIWEPVPLDLALILLLTCLYVLPVLVVAPFIAGRDAPSAVADRWLYVKGLLVALPFTLLWSIFLFLSDFRDRSVEISAGKPAIVSSDFVLVGAWVFWIVPTAIVLRAVLATHEGSEGVECWVLSVEGKPDPHLNTQHATLNAIPRFTVH